MIMISKYILVLYLNQKYVFDILSSMEGGVVQFEMISNTLKKKKEGNAEIDGEIGLNNTFGIVKANLGGNMIEKKSTENKTESTTQRSFTPNSMFMKVRENLYSQKLIKNNLDDIKVGDFIEIEVSISRNPFTHALKSILKLSDIGLMFNENKKETKNIKAVMDKIKKLIKNMEDSTTIDVIGNITNSKYNSTISLDN